MPTLRPYQEKAISLTRGAILAGKDRLYFSLPTGCGKTVVISQLTQTFDRAVLVAHRKELIDQIQRRLTSDWNRSVGVVMGAQNEAAAELVVATQQSLRPERVRGITHYGRVDALFIDEAHHAVPKSRYAEIVDRLAESNPDLHVIGCTATPFRNDRKRMQDLLPLCTFSRTIDEMQREGWLCPLDWRPISVDIDLASIKSVSTADGLDFDTKALGLEAEREEIVEAVVEQTVPLIGDRLTLVFGVTVDHAHALTEAYNRAAVPAATVWGAMPKDERQEVYRRWEHGEIQVVTNFGVLTEGFDFPRISALVVARPTRSPSLYIQMIGRGARTAPGKTDCLVIDVSGNERVDESRQVVLPDVAATVEPIEESIVEPTPRARPLAEGMARKSSRLLTRDPGHDQVYRWVPDEIGYILPAAYGVTLVLLADPHGSGLYQLGALLKDGEVRRLTRRQDSIWEQQRAAHEWLASHGVARIAQHGQEWHTKPATEKQISFLRRLAPNVAASSSAWTSGEASAEIARALAQRNRRPLLEALWQVRERELVEVVF